VLRRGDAATGINYLRFVSRGSFPQWPAHGRAILHRRDGAALIPSLALFAQADARATAILVDELDTDRMSLFRRSSANNPQQSWGFEGEPPKAVLKKNWDRGLDLMRKRASAASGPIAYWPILDS
jgi:hypothetical protein